MIWTPSNPYNFVHELLYGRQGTTWSFYFVVVVVVVVVNPAARVAAPTSCRETDNIEKETHAW
jgi:hypothetical protein